MHKIEATEPLCDLCGLYKKAIYPKIPLYGRGKKKILFIGGAPGWQEDKVGEVFYGEMGQLLRDTVNDLGFSFFDDIWSVHAVSCRPTKPGDRGYSLNRLPTENEIKYCRPLVHKYIEECKPELIVLFGGAASSSVLNFSDIIPLQGFMIPDRELNCWVGSTFHPSQVMRESSKNNDVYIEELWARDLHFFLSSYKESFPKLPLLKYKIGKSIKEIQEYIDTLILTGDKVYVDFETVGLNPFLEGAKIIVCGLYNPKVDECAMIFNVEDAWSSSEFKQLKGILKKLFLSSHVEKVAHNIKFEKLWSRVRLGLDMSPYGCSFLKCYLENEKGGVNSLKHRVWMHYGIRNYEEKIKKHYKDLRKADRNDVFDYNAKDVIYGDAVDVYINESLKDETGLMDVYDNILIPGTQALVESELLGIDVDIKAAEKLAVDFGKKADELELKIEALPEVKKYKEKHAGKFLLSSNKELADFIYNFSHYIEPKRTKKGNLSVDEEVLKSINNDFSKLLLNRRKLMSVKASHLDGCLELVCLDGKIHTSYSLGIASTGRTSSSNPNLQNVPKREFNEIRSIFAAPKNYVLLSCDYSQWEIRVVQMYCKDPELGKAIWDNIDIHAEYTKELYGLIKGDPEFKHYRQLTKQHFVFATIYLARPETIRILLDLPVDLIDSVQKKLFEKYHYLKEWQNKEIAFYSQYGYVGTLFGRKRRAPMNLNMIVNSPVQSTASDFTVLSHLRAVNSGLIPSLNVHDDLTFVVPEDGWDDYYYRVKDYMTKWDFPWINVPIEIEAKVGYNWNEQYDTDKLLL